MMVQFRTSFGNSPIWTLPKVLLATVTTLTYVQWAGTDTVYFLRLGDQQWVGAVNFWNPLLYGIDFWKHRDNSAPSALLFSFCQSPARIIYLCRRVFPKLPKTRLLSIDFQWRIIEKLVSTDRWCRGTIKHLQLSSVVSNWSYAVCLASKHAVIVTTSCKHLLPNYHSFGEGHAPLPNWGVGPKQQSTW